LCAFFGIVSDTYDALTGNRLALRSRR